MIHLLLADDSLVRSMLSESLVQNDELWSWAGRKRNGEPWSGPGRAFYGDPADPATFEALALGRRAVALVCLRDGARVRQAVTALSRARPEVQVLVTTANGELRGITRDNVRQVSWAEVVGERLEAEISRLRTLERVRAVRELLDPAEHVALLLQPDPDPDGIASALALRQVLRRNRSSAPIVTFAAVTRPENLAMLRLLEIELDVIRPAELKHFERVALLDVQANVFGGAISTADVVIDHHPEQKGYPAAFRDIRSSYGATSTMLTEYCRAADVEFSQRLATALLYGIKADTLSLDREASRADIAAFTYLYPRANTNLVRRMEKPELPRSAFVSFARALRAIDLTSGLAYVHLGRVEREDVIPQMAELCLQLEGAEWSAVSGVVGRTLVVSIRNGGYQKAAGGVARAAFGELGPAGGHQAMAKAVVPLRAFRRRHGSTRAASLSAVVRAALRAAIG